MASCVGSALALSATTAIPSRTSLVLDGLRETPLVRASDQALVSLPSLWRANTPFGVADEVVVCAFLRHFGWFLCWEHASQLRDTVLPATKNKKLYFVGVGTGEAAAEFAQQLNIDPALCFADENGAAGDAMQLEQGIKTMWNPKAVNNLMSRNDQDSLTVLGESYKNAADSLGIKKLMPKQTKDTLRQGGTFVFKGNRLVLEHYDTKVGDNCEVEAILAAIRA
jgi:hypothetical protein